MMIVPDVESLRNLLATHGVDTSMWGYGESKSVENLYGEIKSCEAQLTSNPILRTVSVVRVIIKKKEKTLIEKEQILKDGRKRIRNSLPAEKIKKGENISDAVMRCLKEELGVSEESVTINLPPISERTIKKNSPSYPGLQTEYTITCVSVSVDGLPETDFTTREKGDVVQEHVWEWVDRGVFDIMK